MEHKSRSSSFATFEIVASQIFGPISKIVGTVRGIRGEVDVDYFRCWHKCEVTTASSNVGGGGQSEKRMLGLSSSQFDPKPTSSIGLVRASETLANQPRLEI